MNSGKQRIGKFVWDFGEFRMVPFMAQLPRVCENGVFHVGRLCYFGFVEKFELTLNFLTVLLRVVWNGRERRQIRKKRVG